MNDDPSIHQLKMGDPRTTSVIVILTVPEAWGKLTVSEIEGKLKRQPHMMRGLATEVKRWSGSGVIDLSGLQRFIDDRTGKEP